MARMGVDLKGVVSFHGSLGNENQAQPCAVKAKVLVCHGAREHFHAVIVDGETDGNDFVQVVIEPGP